jgi:hypothetical protein
MCVLSHKQIVFIVICVLKLLAISYLCYRAYLPFHKIVVTNKFVQAGAVNSTSTATSTNGGVINVQSPKSVPRTATTTPTRDVRGSVQGSIISVGRTTGL